MRAGTSKIDITPASGAELSGFLARVQPSVGMHDPLLARGLYLEAGDGRLLWLHADLVGFQRDFVLKVKDALGSRLGLSCHQIVLSATHTHSGPATLDLINAGRYDRPYVDWLGKRLTEAAEGAVGSVEETQVVSAEGVCRLAIDRRGQPSAHTDPRMLVLGWRRGDGTYAAVLANYPVHNVVMGSENRLIGADLAGHAAATLSDRLPGNPTVLFTNGACGNLNPPAVGNDFAKVEQWGDELADVAAQALADAQPMPDDTIGAAIETMQLALEEFDREKIAATAAAARPRGWEGDEWVGARYCDAVDRWERIMLRLADDGRLPTTVATDVQVVRLGDVALICVGAEAFSILADELRDRTGQRVHVIGYANGDLGYLAPIAAHEEGGYETGRAFLFYKSLPIRPGEFERLGDRAARMLRAGAR